MKEKKLILLDLFSGLGGFHKGLEDAGFKFKEVYYSEIDKHAIANYKYNFPNAKYIGSVTDILCSGIERPNIITFGSPCQDFSIAGKRAGLGGSKSSLIEYAIAAISHFRPDVFIWENVKGTFSSNAGEDFWSIIKAFADIGGYAGEWQLVNTSWILPQNRERVYFVGHLAVRSWNGVFPIEKNDEAFNEQSRSKLQTASITRSITSNYAKMGGDNTYILDGKKIRRLTEIECERLQGFPDNWTQYGNYDGVVKPIPKTQRYKLCGNAVTAKMVELIGRRIIKNFKQ